jgi:hypothetical protein
VQAIAGQGREAVFSLRNGGSISLTMPLEVASFGLALTTTRSPSCLRLIGRCVRPLLQAAWPTARQIPQETVLSQMQIMVDRAFRGQALPLFTLSRKWSFLRWSEV